MARQMPLDLAPKKPTGHPAGCCQACGTRLQWVRDAHGHHASGSGLEPWPGGDRIIVGDRPGHAQIVSAGDGTHRRHFDHCEILAGKLARLLERLQAEAADG